MGLMGVTVVDRSRKPIHFGKRASSAVRNHLHIGDPGREFAAAREN